MHRIYNIGLEDLKNIFGEVFEVKGCKPVEMGDTVICEGEDRTYRARFREVGRRVEVALSVEYRRGFLKSLRRREPFEEEEDIQRIFKYVEMKLPGKKTRLDEFVEEILKAQAPRVEIPKGMEVEIKAGGIISIRDKEENLMREITAPTVKAVRGNHILMR